MRPRALLPGLLLVAALTAAAWYVGARLPLLGAPVVAVVAGIALSSRAHTHAQRLAPGLSVASRQLLQAAVVLLGLLLSIRDVSSVGLESLPVLGATITTAAVAALVLTRLLQIPRVLATLIAVGTMICGASAIAAVAGVVDPDEDEIAYAMSTIFAFNIAAVLIFPPLGHLLGLSQHGFGLWAGTAINDTSSVVAAATVYGSAALGFAVIVKLARVLMIIPITLTLAWRTKRAASTPVVPVFVIGFVVAVLINSAGLVPNAAHDVIRIVAALLTTAALAAIGLSTNTRALRAAGARPFVFGGMLWVAIALVSLITQHFTGGL